MARRYDKPDNTGLSEGIWAERLRHTPKMN